MSRRRRDSRMSAGEFWATYSNATPTRPAAPGDLATERPRAEPPAIDPRAALRPPRLPSARFVSSEGEGAFTLAELVAANVDAPLDPSDLSALAALGLGESLAFGGGAAAVVTITRVA